MSTQRIKVAARIRPLLDGEVNDDTLRVCRAADSSEASSSSSSLTSYPYFIWAKNAKGTEQKFPFTSCYDGASTQEEIFQNDVQPLIDVVYSGITVTVFAYGVTSSGKTHTMQGSKAEPGIIPRTVQSLFGQSANYEHLDVTFSLSYMEIYKDEVFDLLVPRDSAQKLPVREDGNGVVFVANLTAKPISSVAEFHSTYNRASKQRSVAATNLNHSSSRSHAILTLQVTMTDSAHNQTVVGKILLVDLAGSENNKLTGNDPSRMAESSAINKSLSVLGQVVRALNEGHSRIPYRNSKLTRILQPALGGDSLGLLICNLAPGNKLRQDTFNTLNFASTAETIENKLVVHQHDTVPPPKPHFAALTVNPPKPPVLQPAAQNGKPRAGRTSMVPRYSRLSGLAPFQSFAIPEVKENQVERAGLSDKEFEDKVAKLVEAQVSAQVEKHLKEAEERRQRESKSMEESPPPPPERPEVVEVPVKSMREKTKEMSMSPVSRKKNGRAYVAMARERSQKGDLQAALDLYHRAEYYVPDNIKLKERIIELEWAVKNDKEFIPSPKKTKKKKKEERKRAKAAAPMSDDQMEIEEIAMALVEPVMGEMKTPMHKRRRSTDDDDYEMESSKRRRESNEEEVAEDDEPAPLLRRSPRKRVQA
ncbi:kinesin-like protein [Mycena floridula]|nr:kinesin-like protein [Mycena floridula]